MTNIDYYVKNKEMPFYDVLKNSKKAKKRFDKIWHKYCLRLSYVRKMNLNLQVKQYFTRLIVNDVLVSGKGKFNSRYYHDFCSIIIAKKRDFIKELFESHKDQILTKSGKKWVNDYIELRERKFPKG